MRREPHLRQAVHGRSLTRDEVEQTLQRLGAWVGGKQIRPLTHTDLDELMQANGALLQEDATTGKGLPLADLQFAEGVDLSGLYLAEATLSRAHLMAANLTGARLYHADCCGAGLWRANLENAALHDADMESAQMYGVNLRGALLFRASLRNADLRDAKLTSATLGDVDLRDATLWRADLQDAYLWGADLRGADLWQACLKGADLSGANLQTANLKAAILEDAKLGYMRRENTLPVLANVDGTTCLDGVTWSHEYVCPEETAGGVHVETRDAASTYDTAAKVYRMLKEAHERSGMYELADQFGYREHVCRRKEAVRERWLILLASLWCAELLFGYGYRWKRVVIAASCVLTAFAFIYWAGGLFRGYGPSELAKSLYFSAVSFTGVGYGPWIANSQSPLKYLGALEAFIGVFLMALFLVTFTRRYTR